MNREVVLLSALANTGISNASEELLTFMKDNTSGTEFFKFEPKPGGIYNAAFDWQTVIGTTASIIGIAQALWAAYEKFIVPRKKKDAFLFVQIKAGDKFSQFTIGNQYQDKDIFIQEFTEKVERIRITSNSEYIEIEKQELQESKLWRKLD